MTGITVILFDRTQTGTDPLNHPIYTETPVPVANVLVAPLSDSEILETYNLTGRKAVYQMGIPKGDTHEWENAIVEFWGERWKVFGIPTQGIEANIPLSWHKKVRCERYE